MKQLILDNINNPEELEKLYRQDKLKFANSFKEISAEYDTELIRFWKIRLKDEKEDEKKIRIADISIIFIISLISGIFLKLPEILGIDESYYYPRHLSIIIFSGIIIYTLFNNKILNWKNISIYAVIIIVLIFYVNLLPSYDTDTNFLVYIHIPFFLFCLFGISYISFDLKDVLKRTAFIRFIGEYVIMTGLLFLTAGLLTGITALLFRVIGVDIDDFYLNYIAIFGIEGVILLSFYLIKIYPNITKKIAPVLARIFSPLALATLLAFLITWMFSENQITVDRDLLITFNVMLIAVLAIIVFSLTELNITKINILILLILGIVAMILNATALIAIISRISSGLTPNRTVVLVSNLLIFGNLLLITINLFKAYKKPSNILLIDNTIGRYFNIYCIWILIVIFIIPLVFWYT